jgi:hypothetical protein
VPSTTTRLVTLQPPANALDGVLDALRAALSRVGNGATSVGQADRMPKLSGQPDGACLVVDFSTMQSAGARPVHTGFISAAGAALRGCGVPYAWRHDDGPWQHGAFTSDEIRDADHG